LWNVKPRGQGADWIYSVLPINIALGPIGTLVQLYILDLHGTAIDIGLAITIFNAVSIPAAIMWGYATDRSHRRKSIIVASYLAITGTLILFLFTRTIHGVDLLYALFSLLSSAAATPLNLLIMETQPKSRWTTAFARFQMASSVGVTIGLVIGVAWADFLPLHLMVAPLAALSLASAILAAISIREPAFVFEREMIVMVRRSFYQRLLSLPMLFLRIPRMFDFRKVFRGGLRYELARETQVLYMSIFVFYTASGVFNTSLVPSLYGASLTKSQIFLVLLAGMVVQTVSFHYAAPYIENRSLKQAAFGGLVLRALCYAGTGASAFLVTGIAYLSANMVLYPLAAGIAFATYYAASNIMIFNTLGHAGQGSTLGVYSALVGLATTLGSFISGFISFYFGFYAAFLLAAAFLAAAAGLTSSLSVGEVRSEAIFHATPSSSKLSKGSAQTDSSKNYRGQ
jgi:MFS family permease